MPDPHLVPAEEEVLGLDQAEAETVDLADYTPPSPYAVASRRPLLELNAPYDSDAACLIYRFIAEEGLSEVNSAAYAGIHRTTLNRWRKTVPILVAAKRAYLEKSGRRRTAAADLSDPSSSSSKSPPPDFDVSTGQHIGSGTPTPKPETPPPSPRGRTSIFTSDLAARICHVVRTLGFSHSRAGKFWGVSPMSITRWKREHDDFAADLEIARSEFLANRLTLLMAAKTAAGHAEWRVHKWLLERTFPEEYGPPHVRNRAKASSAPEASEPVPATSLADADPSDSGEEELGSPVEIDAAPVEFFALLGHSSESGLREVRQLLPHTSPPDHGPTSDSFGSVP